MIGKKGFGLGVQKEKSYQNSLLTFLRLERRLKMQASVNYTNLHDNEFVFEGNLLGWNGLKV